MQLTSSSKEVATNLWDSQEPCGTLSNEKGTYVVQSCNSGQMVCWYYEIEQWKQYEFAITIIDNKDTCINIDYTLIWHFCVDSMINQYQS